MKKKAIALLASLALVASVGAGATLAYLTDTTEVVKNTFAIGHVDISIDETVDDTVATKDSEGEDIIGTYKGLLPGVTYDKEPVVTVNADSAECYVFVTVENTTKVLNEDGSVKIDKPISIVEMNKSWRAVTLKEDDVTYVVAYVYKNTVTPDKKTVDGKEVAVDTALDPVFSEVSVSVDVEEDYIISGGISVKAYAIQKEAIADELDAFVKLFPEFVDKECAVVE